MKSPSHCRTVGSAPDIANLHDAALDYLARYLTTEVGLRRVLERRIERWIRRAVAATEETQAIAAQAATARAAADEVIARLIAAGAVNDATYAESRARSLVRAGHSRRATKARLVAKGVDPPTAHAALPSDDESELAAALVLARKRRIGPFHPGGTSDETRRQRELGILARAGFSQSVARQALSMGAEQAETLANRLRR
jgi:regulatory protein